MKWSSLFLVLGALVSTGVVCQPEPAPKKTILAIGAHAGDMELTCGALLAKQGRAGDRTVLLHLTLGEGGNPKLSPEAYGAQKRREAEAAARILGAEVIFAPYRDGELVNDAQTRAYVADVIRQVKPTHIVTHWRNSFHPDHRAAHAITVDAVLPSSLPGVNGAHPAWGGVRQVLYAENWEDMEGFDPYVYLDVSDAFETWDKSVTQYEFVRGGISSYPYLEYYRALFRVRGAEGGFTRAEAFDIDPMDKKQVLRSLP
jgi:LmbE family N-acetylglucosaminyl deacetylase